MIHAGKVLRTLSAEIFGNENLTHLPLTHRRIIDLLWQLNRNVATKCIHASPHLSHSAFGNHFPRSVWIEGKSKKLIQFPLPKVILLKRMHLENPPINQNQSKHRPCIAFQSWLSAFTHNFAQFPLRKTL